jgi:hypothetical protein
MFSLQSVQEYFTEHLELVRLVVLEGIQVQFQSCWNYFKSDTA